MEIVDSIGLRVLPEMRGFKAQVEKEIRKIDTSVKIDVEMGKVDTSAARISIEGFREVMEREEIELRAELDLDTARADRQLDSVREHVRAATSSNGDLDRSNGRLGASFLALGGSVGVSALKFGALAGAIAPALTLLSSVQLAVAQMVPIFALLPAALTSAAVAIGALKVGLSGFGEALKNVGDPEKFAESIKDLSPAARAAAIAIRDLRDPFIDLRKIVQERLFAGLADEITKTGKTLLPILRSGLAGVAAEFNNIGRSVLQFARTPETVSALNVAMRSTKGVMANVAEAVVPILQGFREIAKVGLSMLPGLTDGFGSLAVKFRDWATSIAQSGRLEEMIKSAIGAFQDLGASVLNIGRIIKEVLDVATGSGEGLFASLREGTDIVLKFLRSADGQTALTSFFTALKTITAGLAPVFRSLTDALVFTIIPAFEALAPAIAAGLSALAPAFTPLADVLAALAPVIGALAQQVAGVLVAAFRALGPVIVTLAPVLQTLANLLGQTLTGIIVAIAPLLLTLAQVLSEVLGAALKVIEPLLPVIVQAIGEMANIISGTLTAALPTLIQVAEVMGGALAQAITTLAPMLPQIVTSWSQMVMALIPLLPQLARLAAEVLPQVISILPQLLPLLVSLTQMWVEILAAMMPVIDATVSTLIPALNAIIGVVSSVVDTVVPLVQGMFDFFSGTIGYFVKLITGDFDGAWESAKQAVRGAFHVIEGIVKTVGTILTAPIRVAIDTVTSLFRNAGGDFGNAIRGAINAIPAALSGVGDMLFGSGKALIQGFIRGIGDMIGSAVQKAKDLVGAVRDFFPFSPAKKGPFSGLGYTLYSGRALAEDFASGIRERTFLAAQATANLMDAAALDSTMVSGNLRSLDGAVERSFSFRAESMAGEVSAAVKEGLASAEFTIDQNGIFRVNQKADLNYNRR